LESLQDDVVFANESHSTHPQSVKPASKSSDTTAAQPKAARSAWVAFRHKPYTVIWTVTLVSNIGTWMYSASSGWLMTNLNASPLMVSLVQTASTLPIFLLAVPSGALTDILDKRRFLIAGETSITILSLIFALLVSLNRINAGTLLLFAFLIAAGGALVAPAWQAIAPELVPREDLAPALSADSVGINISRAIGPALGGLLAGAFGIAAPFWINGLSNFGVIGGLFWWRRPKGSSTARHLPAEHFTNAMKIGLRHARHNPHLRATLWRAIPFFVFASTYWALLPLVAREQVSGGATVYGLLLGAIGGGAIAGAFAMPRLAAKLGPNCLVTVGELGTALSLLLFGAARTPIVALAGSVVAGACWITVLSNLNVSAQVALPAWVRGRGLALFVALFSGTMALGSVMWGELARLRGTSMAHYIAAAGLAVAVPVARRWKLQTGEGMDLTPSMHWPMPATAEQIESDVGPVLVTVEYVINPNDRKHFLAALDRLAPERRRDGAYAWGVFEDSAKPGRFVETFLAESWLEHLRQHERVTKADQLLEERVLRFAIGTPKVTHFIAARTDASATPRG
jgi:predicted MFS family arabinose efflux permease